MFQQIFRRSSAQNRGLGGNVRLKSGEPAPVPTASCRRTENGDLAWTAALSKMYCHKRYINLFRRKVCSVYHVLRKCIRGDRAVYLHRAGPGAMGHWRCFKGYDRGPNSIVRNNEERPWLGSETISLVWCHMTYKPPQADSPQSCRIIYAPCRAAIAPWLLRYPRCPKRALHFSLYFF